MDTPDAYPTDAEMRLMYERIADLHAALQYIQQNGPPMLAALQDNPMLKMMGASKMFGGT